MLCCGVIIAVAMGSDKPPQKSLICPGRFCRLECTSIFFFFFAKPASYTGQPDFSHIWQSPENLSYSLSDFTPVYRLSQREVLCHKFKHVLCFCHIFFIYGFFPILLVHAFSLLIPVNARLCTLQVLSLLAGSSLVLPAEPSLVACATQCAPFLVCQVYAFLFLVCAVFLYTTMLRLIIVINEAFHVCESIPYRLEHFKHTGDHG